MDFSKCIVTSFSFYSYILFLAVADEALGQTGVIPAPVAWTLIVLLIVLKRQNLFILPVRLTKHYLHSHIDDIYVHKTFYKDIPSVCIFSLACTTSQFGVMCSNPVSFSGCITLSCGVHKRHTIQNNSILFKEKAVHYANT